MALNSSGPISLGGTTAGQSIELENGGNGTTQISLNDAAVRSLAGVPSGAITMPTNFYGKANEFFLTISTNQTNANLRSLAVTAGWNQSSKVTATINSGVIVSSNSTGTAALTVDGSWPGGVTLVNNGTIVGMGGAGGGGGQAIGSIYYSGAGGSSGGTGLSVSAAVSVNNGSGVIAGGGGGGGGQNGYRAGCDCGGFYGAGGGGGSGGRSSNAANSAGGAGGYSSFGANGANGGAGTYAAAGTGGASNGGNWGSSGGSSSQAGGSGGSCTSGAGTYITWIATGTRYGAIN